MKVLFINSLHPAKDTRLFQKEAKSLSEDGYKVVIIGPYLTKHERIGNIVIKGVNQPKNRIITLFYLFKIAIHQKPNVIQCNELDSWFVGVLLGRIRKIPVIFDAHEYYPSRLDDKVPAILKKSVQRILKFYMKFLSLFSHRVITVSEVIKRRYDFLACPVCVIHNYSDELILKKNVNIDILSDYYPVLIHTGLINLSKGLQTIVEGVALLKKNYPKILCLFIGKNSDLPENQKKINRLIKKLNIGKNIKFVEWIDYEKISGYLRTATIGLIMFDINITNNKLGLPQKFFEYLYTGLPVVAPDGCEVGNIVRKYHVGNTVNSRNSQDLLIAVENLIASIENNKVSREEIRNIAEEKFSWGKEKIKYINIYREITNCC